MTQASPHPVVRHLRSLVLMPALPCVLGLLVVGTAWADKPAEAGKGEKARVDLHGDPLPPEAVARLGTVRFRTARFRTLLPAGQIAVSPDGQTVAAVADDALTLWDKEGRPIRRIVSESRLLSVAFTPDGKSVAVGDENCGVTLHDLATGRETRKFVPSPAKGPRSQHEIWSIAFAADGETFITWGSDKVVRTWGVRAGKELRQLPLKDLTVEDVSPDGRTLAVTAKEADKAILLLDVATGRQIGRLNHAGIVFRAVFSADGKTLAVSTDAPETSVKIVLWERDGGKELGTLTSHEAAVFALAFSPDGKYLASGEFLASGESAVTLRLWDLGTRKELHKARCSDGTIYQLRFSRDGKALFLCDIENHIRRWDVASWGERPTDGPRGAIVSVAYSPDGRLIASASEEIVWVWDAVTGEVVRKLEDHPDSVSAVAFAADGKSLVATSQGGMLHVWDLASGKELRHPLGLQGRKRNTALSPDGTTYAVWGRDNVLVVIGLWDVRTGKEIRTLEVTPEMPVVHSLRLSTDGKTLVAASSNYPVLLRWDVATGNGLSPLGRHDGGVNHVALAPDGRSLASVSRGGTLCLWEAATGQVRLTVKDAGYATSAAFSPDGRFLVLANDGTHSHSGVGAYRRLVEYREEVRLVSTADGRVIHRFVGHAGGIGCLSFAPDGKALASGGHDTTVLLWDVAGQVKPAPAAPLKDKDLQTAWSALRGDAVEAYHAVVALSSAPAQTVRFLGERIKPVRPLTLTDAERIPALVKALDDDQFSEREDATRALQNLGDAAEPALRKVLEGTPSPETRRRVKDILDSLSGVADSSERLRVLRAVEVLERVGDRDARALLRRLAGGTPGAWLTEEAKTTLRRLEGKARP